jgi:hypothetical protein
MKLAKSMIYSFAFALPRIYVRQLFMRFRRVPLDFLEAQLRPVEQLDKRTPRGKSRLGADHQGRVID